MSEKIKTLVDAQVWLGRYERKIKEKDNKLEAVEEKLDSIYGNEYDAYLEKRAVERASSLIGLNWALTGAAVSVGAHLLGFANAAVTCASGFFFILTSGAAEEAIQSYFERPFEPSEDYIKLVETADGLSERIQELKELREDIYALIPSMAS